MASTATKSGQNPLDEGAAPASYEHAVAELEALVARMENGALSLEDSLVAYRRGSQLVAFCQQQLEKVEQQVRMLDANVLKPLDTGAASSSSFESKISSALDAGENVDDAG